MKFYELNLDGLVGPTHHYAGLSSGNMASTIYALKPANPLAAALQGIEKMRLIHSLGIKQAFIPPQIRPNLNLLHQVGFQGSTQNIIKQAAKDAPDILSACFSASSMWTANAATISPSIDSHNNRINFTAANLITNLHRHQEAPCSRDILKQIFNSKKHFIHHNTLPSTAVMSDEGAANHCRLCANHSEAGINLFVYNKRYLPAGNTCPTPKKFPARQSLEASEAVARQHQLNPGKTIFAQQNPNAVDLGVFHNDVIAVANESLLLVHQDAFYDQEKIINELRLKADFALNILEIKRENVTIAEAVKTYLFNSQLITLPDSTMTLIAPIECKNNHRVSSCINGIIDDISNPISSVHFVDLKQSMQNGGGPACTRLRVIMNNEEIGAMHQGVLVSNELLDKLCAWVTMHYRDKLQAEDLVDPNLIVECNDAFDSLLKIINIGYK